MNVHEAGLDKPDFSIFLRCSVFISLWRVVLCDGWVWVYDIIIIYSQQRMLYNMDRLMCQHLVGHKWLLTFEPMMLTTGTESTCIYLVSIRIITARSHHVKVQFVFFYLFFFINLPAIYSTIGVLIKWWIFKANVMINAWINAYFIITQGAENAERTRRLRLIWI